MLLYVIVGISSLSIIGFYSYFKAKQALIARAFEQLNSVKSIKKLQIENYFGEHKHNKNEYRISINDINSIMLDTNRTDGLGLSGEVYIVGDDFYLKSKSRFFPDSKTPVHAKTESIRKAFLHGNGNSIGQDYRNELCLSSYDKLSIPGLNWIILAEIDYKEAMIPITNLRNDLIFVSIIVIILILSIAQVISSDIIIPILKLKNAALRIGKGDLKTKVNINSENEFGVLAATFNQMTDNIEKNTIELLNEKTKRISALYDGQEFERQRISRDLHDGLAQHLIAIKMNLENLIRRNEFLNKENTNELRTQLNNAIDELRKISYDLAPVGLLGFSLEAALENLCNQVQKNSGISIDFFSFGNLTDLNQRCKIYLYRIVQEALHNAIKHSEASSIDIQITETNQHFVLMIEDNGKGFDFDTKNLGLGQGLFNIRERSILLNGTFDVESFPGKGTTIRVKINKCIDDGKN